MLATLEEVKDYLRIDYDEDDEMLGGMQIAAQSYLENAVENFAGKIEEDKGFREKARILLFCIIQEWYDNREQREQGSLSYAIRSLMLQLQAGGA